MTSPARVAQPEGLVEEHDAEQEPEERHEQRYRVVLVGPTFCMRRK